MHPLCHVLPALALVGCSGPGVLNALTPSGGHRHVEGVVYDSAHKLRLDVFAPPVAHGAPAIVFLQGGRWRASSRADYRYVGQALASRGFVAVVPDMRAYPSVRFPAFVQDAARAVRWAQQHASRYGGHPDRVFVMGHSSGAHVAALLALDPEWLREAGADHAKLKGMIGLAGPYDFLPLTAPDLRDLFGPPERFQLSQPISFVDGANPPLLLLHGDDDETVRVDNTHRLAAAVARAGGPVETVVYPGMGHAWIIATLAAPLRANADVLDRIEAFVRRHAAGMRAIQTREVPPS